IAPRAEDASDPLGRRVLPLAEHCPAWGGELPAHPVDSPPPHTRWPRGNRWCDHLRAVLHDAADAVQLRRQAFAAGLLAWQDWPALPQPLSRRLLRLPDRSRDWSLYLARAAHDRRGAIEQECRRWTPFSAG